MAGLLACSHFEMPSHFYELKTVACSYQSVFVELTAAGLLRIYT